MSRPLRYLSLLISAVIALAGLQALALSGSAAPPDDGYWAATDRRPGGDRGDSTRRVEPKRYAAFTLDRAGISAALDRAPAEESARADDAGAVVTVPAPNGELIDFRVQQVAVMEAGLAARHPEITTYAGRAVGDPTATIRLDLTPMGFHASVRGDGNRPPGTSTRPTTATTASTSPTAHGDLPRSDRGAGRARARRGHRRSASARPAEAPGTEVKLRTYRLALRHRPALRDLLRQPTNVTAAKVTLINRVNQIYNDDLAIRLVLIDDTDKLNLNTAAQGTGAERSVRRGACFTAAQLASCAGATLQPQPHRARPAHRRRQLRHRPHRARRQRRRRRRPRRRRRQRQGAAAAPACPTPDRRLLRRRLRRPRDGPPVRRQPHLQRHAAQLLGGNRNAGTSVEPGSGSSIMAYAGICRQDNLQPHSDPYFSQRSYDEITRHRHRARARRSTRSRTSRCATSTATATRSR